MFTSPVCSVHAAAGRTGQSLVQSLVIPHMIFLTQCCHEDEHLLMGIPCNTGCSAIQWQLLLIPCFLPYSPHPVFQPLYLSKLKQCRLLGLFYSSQDSGLWCARRDLSGKQLCSYYLTPSVSISNFNVLRFWSTIQKESWYLTACKRIPAHPKSSICFPSHT